ncbi:MAG TPA: D-aminoacylase [Longimicrobiales bacterium]|nr:D-aminoacylase [Longimicrobiales bacterium]
MTIPRRTFVLRSTATAAGVALGGSSMLAAGSADVGQHAGPHTGQAAGQHASPADLVLRGATVYDGLGNTPVTADVAVTGGRITAIGPNLAAADNALDLNGLALAPGFIDIHSHTDTQLARDPRADSKVRQGVTTEVAGQDGSSVTGGEFGDVAGFLRWVDANGAAVNMASMIGAGTVRGAVIGNADRRATPAELQRMQQLIRDALAGGACGISTGLEYTPGAFADTAELEALASVLRGTGLPFASHMRNEDDRLVAAMEEVIGIGHRAGVPVQVSHLKAQGERNWWKTDVAFGIIEAARDAGIDAMFDVYPYVAYSTGLSNLFPITAREGGTDAFLRRLQDPATAPDIERAVRDKIAMLGDWDAVQLTAAGSQEYAWVAGQRLGALAQRRNTEPYALLLDIIIGDRSRTRMVGFGMSEENVERKLAHPHSMICSDGGAMTRGDGTPHPRNYGAFPRVLGHYVRERGIMPLETAIAKMTSIPARRLGFTDRGRIAVGAAADLVAFDPATVADRATFEDPHQFPVGIPHVIVNGTFVIRDGEHTGARPGRAVRPG